LALNLRFFPSRRLALYCVRLFLTRTLVVLVCLSLILLTLDVVGESGKILAVPGNTQADVWRYTWLRLPIILSQNFPRSVLLGTLILFVGLNQHNEVVSMKAAGLSAHQILAPLLLASIGLAAVQFVFNETLVVKSASVVSRWSDNDYKPLPRFNGVYGNVWLRSGDDLISVNAAGGSPFRASGVTIYQRQGGNLQRIVKADQAVPIAGSDQWRLDHVTTFDVNMHAERQAPVAAALAGITPRLFAIAKVDPSELPIWTLKQRIAELYAAGKPTEEAETGYIHKVSGPLSIVLMPLLAAIAAFGLARSGQVLARAAIGMALGFTYFFVDNICVAMGNAGAYSPAVAAWAPFLLFLLVGETVLIRTEE
jgi:lipopolysaccharide export system permease protein